MSRSPRLFPSRVPRAPLVSLLLLMLALAAAPATHDHDHGPADDSVRCAACLILERGDAPDPAALIPIPGPVLLADLDAQSSAPQRRALCARAPGADARAPPRG